MKKGTKVIIAIVLGLLAALFGMLYLSAEKEQMLGSSEVVKVYVATEDIPANTLLDKDKIATRDVPKSYQQPQSITTNEIPDKANLKGVTIVPIKANEQIVRTKLWEGSAPPLAKDMKARPGMVAVGVAIKYAEMALAGLVKPGNHVDVLASFKFEKTKDEDFTEVRPLLQNVEVVAVNDISVSDIRPFIPAKAGEEKQTEKTQTVTLSLRPENAQQIILAQQLGNVWLLLRGEADGQNHTYEVWNNERLLGANYRLWKGDPRQELMNQALRK